MKEEQKHAIYEQAKQWIMDAGQKIHDKIDEPLYVDTKANPNDLVTQMDRNTEKFFVDKIKNKYPNHRLLSEEGYGDEIDSMDGTIWIIDPIDGTMNFVHQKRNFAISIGIYHDGVGEIGFIYDVMDDLLYSVKRGEGAYKNNQKLPLLDDKKVLEESIVIVNNYWATENRVVDEKKIQDLIQKVRGTRSYGSAALEFAYLAEGIADAYLTMQLSPWDVAAGIILVNEVGGITTSADGSPVNLVENTSILSANINVHSDIIENFIRIK